MILKIISFTYWGHLSKSKVPEWLKMILFIKNNKLCYNEIIKKSNKIPNGFYMNELNFNKNSRLFDYIKQRDSFRFQTISGNNKNCFRNFVENHEKIVTSDNHQLKKHNGEPGWWDRAALLRDKNKWEARLDSKPSSYNWRTSSEWNNGWGWHKTKETKRK